MNDKDHSVRHSALAKAVCLDLPYILDSVWRHAEYDLNRAFRYDIDAAGVGGVRFSLTPRPYLHTPSFWFFALTLLFVAYGSTFDAWCSVVGARGMRVTHYALGGVVLVAAAAVWFKLARYGSARAAKRFLKAPVLLTEHWRRRFVGAGVQFAVLLPVAGLVSFGWNVLAGAAQPVCHRVTLISPAWWQLLLFAAVLVINAQVAGRARGRHAHLLRETVSLVGLAAVLWWLVARADASEANQGPFPHVYGVFACLLGVLACLSPRIARGLMGSVSSAQSAAFKSGLAATELFPGSRVDPEISGRRFWSALLTGVSYHLLHFLLLPSLFALMVPSRFLLLTFATGAFVSAWLLMAGNFTSRWQAMVEQVRRWFLVGTPLAVSLVVVALALMRLARISYVTTVLDAAPFGVIFVWIIMAYALLWWFEYSINSSLGMELLGVLGPEDGGSRGSVRYVPAAADDLNVDPTHRFIVIHGPGRFAALGWFTERATRTPTVAFQTFDLVELFARLVPAALDDFWHDLRRRIALYFLVMNCLVLLVIGAGLTYYGRGDRENTVASLISAAPPTSSVRLTDLAALLKDQPRGTPAFIVAASGGGTRAALFTAAALEGLRNLHVARNIVLISGVSGGGVAAAYFYAHRAALLANDDSADREWQLFKQRMTEPFIGDVLEGAGEWRVMSRQPLGRLLAESFERRLFDLDQRQALLGDSAQLALILNTTITAHPQEDSDLLRGAFLNAAGRTSCDSRHYPYAMVGGGRLIFTNLSQRDVFPPAHGGSDGSTRLRLPDVGLPYVVVQDPAVRLASAAALNANFPPVFTNARVDVATQPADPDCPSRAYYVTDGGAHENLGLVSALYALRGALEVLAPDEIPPLHIVTIEASAAAYDYAPDRGIDAATGGSKERLTGGLTQELLNDVTHRAGDGADGSRRVHVHDLALPLAFRSRGGFGTHWMFPPSITIDNPRVPRPLAWYQTAPAGDRSSVVLDKQELIDLWSGLHSREDFCAMRWAARQQRVADWVCGTPPGDAPALAKDINLVEWRALVDSLKE